MKGLKAFLRDLIFPIYIFLIRIKTWFNRHILYQVPSVQASIEKWFVLEQYSKYLKNDLDLQAPRTFNEKIQWLKLYGERNADFHMIVDKLAVREYVTEKVGEEYLNQLIHVYDRGAEIDFNDLPESFVLRMNHGSGWNIICHSKDELDIERAVRKIRRWEASDYYDTSREWVYKNIEPKIILETYLKNDNRSFSIEDLGLLDYKVWCFHGNPQFIQVDLGRYTHHRRAFYDMNWKKQPFTTQNPNFPGEIPKPKKLDELVQVAKILAPDFPYSRIDFYIVQDQLIFGEITFFQGGGHETFIPTEYDLIIGEKIKLPGVKK